VLAICERDGRATIAGVRDELGTSRRYAQALLEHLDAEKLTRRIGDAHVLRRR
jgi:selenocysteine-specific elongation factor